MRLYIYDDGSDKPWTAMLENASLKGMYYAAMRLIRSYRRNGGHVPYMECTHERLNWFITCKRVNINTKYWKEYNEC